LREATTEDEADFGYSSGMCKAGFAGDDAPRAVFRKSTQPILILSSAPRLRETSKLTSG